MMNIFSFCLFSRCLVLYSLVCLMQRIGQGTDGSFWKKNCRKFGLTTEKNVSIKNRYQNENNRDCFKNARMVLRIIANYVLLLLVYIVWEALKNRVIMFLNVTLAISKIKSPIPFIRLRYNEYLVYLTLMPLKTWWVCPFRYFFWLLTNELKKRKRAQP